MNTDIEQVMKSEGKRLLSYIDILGFSKIIETEPERIQPILCDFIDETSEITNWNSDFGLLYFSDTIILYAKYTGKTESTIWLDLVCLTRTITVRLLAKRIPIRGVISFGTFETRKYREQELFWGKALLDAHKDENKENIVGVFFHKEAIPSSNPDCTHKTFVDCYDNDFALMANDRILINPFQYLADIPDGESIDDAIHSYGDLYSDEISAYHFLFEESNNEKHDKKTKEKYINALKYADTILESKWNGSETRQEELLHKIENKNT